MPQQEVGRGDVEITVDYGDSIGTKNALICNAWARVGNSRIKGFITKVTVPKPETSEQEVETIIAGLNNQDGFVEEVRRFIDFMTKPQK